MKGDVRQHWLAVISHSHTWSGRPDHGGVVEPPDNYTALSTWCRKHQIDALGMGSPYSPQAAATYRKYDQESPESYYLHPERHYEILEAEQREVQTMLDAANAIAHGHTTFFLDNETPKGRYGHLWWINHHPDFPAWHDFDQPFDRWMCTHPDAKHDGDEPMPYERRPYMQILAAQRAHGAVGVWAHPTSWWFAHNDGRFITNLATEMPAHAFAEGFLDGMVVMGYHADRPEYRALWLALLDRGIRVPAMAEMDMSLSDEKLMEKDRVYRNMILCMDDDPLVPLESKLADSVRAGHVICSSGPMLTLSVDRKIPGETAVTSQGTRHVATINIEPTPTGQLWDQIQLLGREGKVIGEVKGVESGTLEFAWTGQDHAGYVIAIALSNKRASGRHEHVIVTSPVYLMPQSAEPRRAMTTELKLEIKPDSPFENGEVWFESANGERLGEASITSQSICETLPASGRITLRSCEGLTRTLYLLNANERLQEIQRYLYRGRFRRDFPDLKPGELPVEVWRLDDYEQAIKQMELTI